jgi:light-regulated signal transduction histidine kinase (bacteriophytochrome)
MQAGEAIEEIIKAVEAVLAEGGLNPQQLTFVNTIHQNSKHLHTLDSALPSLESALRQILPPASHEIKAPLMSMRGYSQLLSEHPEQFGGALSPRQQESLGFISRQAEALWNWYQAFIDSGKEEMNQQHKALPQACDLAEILQHSEAVLQFYLQQGKRPVQLQFFIPENLPPIFAASYHLSQLIIHIIDVMATELIEYGKITVSAESDGTLVNLRIFCTGIGSSTAEIHSLFEKEGRHAYRKRFEQQGGRIEFSREAGLGAAVHLLIAIAKN